MARTTATVSFQSLELKGSLLPASLLEEVSKLQRPKDLYLDAADYGLPRGERLRDRIDAAWVLTKELWEEYRNLEERAGSSTAGLHFGLRLLREVLGWREIEPKAGWSQGESHYPITHRAFGGAVPLILRGLASNELDTGSAQFGQEGRKRSPHSCLQECLNADDSANWGVLISGSRLRLLHDNPSLVKPAYLAADLELLIEGELFDEFAVLWLLLHASRFHHPQSGSCVLDGWKQQAEASGERVLFALRGGVQTALQELGNGFLNHPANGALCEALHSGQLSRQQFHEQLLRLVYRFLFLFTAEDRELLFPHELKQDARRRIYKEGYSLHRLRELAIKRSAYEGSYGDLWELQRLVFHQLGIGNSPLGLPGLGGLFDQNQCSDLDSCELWNGALLKAIKAIGWFESGGSATRVRYRDLNTEELGSVYEGLLELQPPVERQGNQWQLTYGGGAGSDRKTTGSYYTPDALVQELIKSALIPVIDDRLSKAHGQAEQERALLGIKVIDPACGSGHFLLAAARRLAVELAQVRAGDDQPGEEHRQHALRDVVANCIYAVDKNPMAVQLCKVALWMEAIDPGKPLGFLDAHIQCGDSLVGVFDPKVLEEGIPDEAYKQLTGDDKTVCSSLKKDNAAARKTISRRGSNRGIQGSLDLSGTKPRSRNQEALEALEAMPEATLAESAAKQAAYANWLEQSSQDPEALAADLFTAAFFLAKTCGSRAMVPTTEHLLRLLGDQAIEKAMEEAVVQASQNFRFFHWHLRFGEVISRGGFDCILGNPPWEMSQLNEVEFFSTLFPGIGGLRGAERKQRIQDLRTTDKQAFDSFELSKRGYESSNTFWKHSHFKYSGEGRINVYALFTEIATMLSRKNGHIGLIVPSQLATDSGQAELLKSIISRDCLISFYDFENRKPLFQGIDPRNKFCLLTIGPDGSAASGTKFMFFLQDVADLSEPKKLFSCSQSEILQLNPNTQTIAAFRSIEDKQIALSVYNRVPVLLTEEPSADVKSTNWSITLRQGLFNKTSDSHHFAKGSDLLNRGAATSSGSLVLEGKKYLRLYEGKMIHQYSHRWNTFDFSSQKYQKPTRDESAACDWEPFSEFYVSDELVNQRLDLLGWDKEWLLGYRFSTAPTNERTVIASYFPVSAVSNMLPIMLTSTVESAVLLAFLNSIPFDYLTRQKMSRQGLDLYKIKQVPVPHASDMPSGVLSAICSRVLHLLKISNGPGAIINELNDSCPASLLHCTAEPREVRAEIDALCASLYGLNADELNFILDPSAAKVGYPSETFTVLRAKEISEFGEYKTRRLVLEAWNRLFGR